MQHLMQHLVVVGASLAGMNAAEELRRSGFAGAITMIGAEPHAPYDRPPLSKAFLKGDPGGRGVELRSAAHLEQLDLTWRTGVRAVGLDPVAREVALSDGSSVVADGMLLATGAAPRRLPGQHEHGHVFELRTLDDSLALGAELQAGGRRVAIIGAGFIGLEVAATARELGNDVVVLEGGPAPLIRVLGPELGSVMIAVHADHGVPIRCGVRVDALAPGGLVVDGEFEPADVVVVGIGAAPVVEWLDGSGVELGDGVITRPDLNVGFPFVYAAGDIVRWVHPLFDEQIRVEQWTNAADQGAAAALNLLAEAAGEPTAPFDRVPFFWSEQYDRRIQFVGLGQPADVVEIVAGSVEERKLLALVGKDGRLRGAFGLNNPRLVTRFRMLLAERPTWDEAVARARDLTSPSA